MEETALTRVFENPDVVDMICKKTVKREYDRYYRQSVSGFIADPLYTVSYSCQINHHKRIIEILKAWDADIPSNENPSRTMAQQDIEKHMNKIAELLENERRSVQDTIAEWRRNRHSHRPHPIDFDEYDEGGQGVWQTMSVL
jgi:hypothetical protein